MKIDVRLRLQFHCIKLFYSQDSIHIILNNVSMRALGSLDCEISFVDCASAHRSLRPAALVVSCVLRAALSDSGSGHAIAGLHLCVVEGRDTGGQLGQRGRCTSSRMFLPHELGGGRAASELVRQRGCSSQRSIAALRSGRSVTPIAGADPTAASPHGD
jgi:hypothetical protein